MCPLLSLYLRFRIDVRLCVCVSQSILFGWYGSNTTIIIAITASRNNSSNVPRRFLAAASYAEPSPRNKAPTVVIPSLPQPTTEAQTTRRVQRYTYWELLSFT
jgi:hypothetical protein